MKLIPLTRNLFAQVDDDRYEELRQYNWHAQWNSKSVTFYAARNQNIAKPGEPWKNSQIRMHRQILGLSKNSVNGKGKKLHGMHWDRDGLNNQADNLFSGTNSENAMNRKDLMDNNTSGFKGVYTFKGRVNKPHYAFVKVDGEMKGLGSYSNFDDAVKARLAGEEKYYGAFARKRGTDEE